MASEGTRGEIERPLMVNGFWPEDRRPDAEAAAEEIGRLGDFKIAFSPQQEQHTPEYDDGGVVNWIKGKLGAAEEESTVQPPVVLRVWPQPELRDKVAEVMDRRGAERINCWGGAVEANRDESLDAIRAMERE